MSDETTTKRGAMAYRIDAAAKAKAAGLQTKDIRQRWNKAECRAYVDQNIWPVNRLEPMMAPHPLHKPEASRVNTSLPATQTPPEQVNIPLPVQTIQASPVNTSLPAKKKAHKGQLANGRNTKGVPKFENWFCRIYPRDITYPAWKELSKTATDIANICRAKKDHAKALGKKYVDGNPAFEFTFAEAANFFKISRPTFDKSIKQLLELGFIEYANRGGILDGKGIAARYRCCERWREWKAEPQNISKATPTSLQKFIQKQNPSKPVLHKLVNASLPVGGEIC
jgi:predicted transcriptional regulator